MKYSDELCSTCNGSGEGMHDGTICHVCRGRGVVILEIDDSINEEEKDEDQHYVPM